jgi:hypothetical protein
VQVGYDGATAASENVAFSYDLAREAARDLWALAERVRVHQGDWSTAIGAARADWVGPKRDRFEDDLRAEDATASAMAVGLEDVARQIAQSWADARGQQNRINWARWQDDMVRREDDTNVLQKFANGVAHTFGRTTDFGPTPEDPPSPAPPTFDATGEIVHPEYEHGCPA